MAGGRTTLVLLVLASIVVVTAIVLDRFPEVTSDLLARLVDATGPHAAGHGHEGHGREVTPMKPGHGFWIALLVLLLGTQVALATPSSTIVLSIDGMT